MMKKKRIVFVVERLSTGGAERVVAALANKISEYEEYDVYIMNYFPKEEGEYYVSSKVHRIEMPKSNVGRIKSILFKYKHLRETLKQINPYCVFSLAIPKTNVILSVALRDRRYPLIISERNDPESFPVEKYMRIMRDYIYTKCEGLVFQTEGAKNYFSKKIQKKSTVICNPLTSTLPERYEGEREHRIVNFCRIEPQKNLKMTIDAFAKIKDNFPDYTLEFYGEGSQKKELEDYVVKCKMEDRVIFHGYSSNIHHEILKAALFVSSSNYEGISNSMLEAMAIGLPAICTDCPPGGARSTIQDGYNGFLVSVGDSSALAAAIEKVLKDNNKMQQFSINAAELKETLRVEAIAQKWLEFMEEARNHEFKENVNS